MCPSWIPEELKGNVTFFSEYDLWDYSNINYHTCKNCFSFSSIIYSGDELRNIFPDLVIIDEDTIYPSTHQNCTCAMHRVTSGEGGRVIGVEDSYESSIITSYENQIVEESVQEAVQDFGIVW